MGPGFHSKIAALGTLCAIALAGAPSSARADALARHFSRMRFYGPDTPLLEGRRKLSDLKNDVSSDDIRRGYDEYR